MLKWKTKTYAIIKVIDYGIGIPEEELNSVFERFYQTRNKNISAQEGSGLGLAYIKHLVKIHNGEINIKSKLHKGTTCTVTIPISKDGLLKKLYHRTTRLKNIILIIQQLELIF